MKNKTLSDLSKITKNVKYNGIHPNIDNVILLEKREKDILAVVTNGVILITKIINDEKLHDWLEGDTSISQFKASIPKKDLMGTANCDFFKGRIATPYGIISKKPVQFPNWRNAVNFSAQSVDKLTINNEILLQGLKTVKDLGHKVMDMSFTSSGFIKINYSEFEDEIIIICPMKKKGA
jgi:hypothetical protein